MRKTALLSIAIASALALGAEIARAEHELGRPGTEIGPAAAATGYVMPFDPAQVALDAPLGPLMAFGPSSPDEARAKPNAPTLDHDDD